MHPYTGLESEDEQPCATSHCATARRAVTAWKVREADAHSPKRWAIGRTTSSTSRCLVVMGWLEVQQAAADGRSRRGEMGRSIDRCTSRSTRKRRHATSSWLAAWRPVTVEIV